MFEFFRVGFRSVIISIVIASIYLFAAHSQISVGGSDFIGHALAAEKIFSGEGSIPPHFIWQILLYIPHIILKITYIESSYIIIFITVFFTSQLAFTLLSDDKKVKYSYILVSILLLFITHPIVITFLVDKHLYYGFFSQNVYHNPSILLLKLVALLHFVTLLKFTNSQEFKLQECLGLVVLTVLSAVVKPNYLIVIIPAVAVFSLFNMKKARFYLFSVILPGTTILILQGLYFYNPESNNKISFSVFEIYLYNSSIWLLIPKLVLSIAFPISLGIVFKNKFLNSAGFKLIGLMFLFALLYAYFLVDTINGRGSASGNFWWSVQVSSFLMYFYCIKFYLKIVSDIGFRKMGIMQRVPLFIGGLHLISGIIWLMSNSYMLSTKLYW